MVTFRSRFAPRRDILLLFGACVFPVQVWSIVNVLREVPAWVLRLSLWDLIGVIAYTQAFALLESAIIFLVLILLGAILPGRLFRDRFVAQGSMAVFLTSAWAVAAHYSDDAIRLWSAKMFLLGFAVYLASVAVFYGLIHRHDRLAEAIRSLVERLLVLSLLYVSIDVLSLLIVAFRNVRGAL